MRPLASIYCELGDEARCREAFELVAAGDFAGLPRDEEWLFGMTLLAPVCAFLGEEARAASLYDLMSPYADRNALSVPDLSTGAVPALSASSPGSPAAPTRPRRTSSTLSR